MKKEISGPFLLVVMGLLLILISGCADSGSDTPQSSAQISFTIDGITHTWSEGYRRSATEGSVAIESSAQGWIDSENILNLFATQDRYDLDSAGPEAPEDYIWFGIDDAGASGTYPNIEKLELRIAGVYYSCLNVNVEITTFDDVNGFIIGTFSGIIFEEEVYNITNGRFKVLRLEAKP